MTLRKLTLLTILLSLALSLTAFASPVSAAAQGGTIPWWAWVLIVLALLIFAAVLIMWWLGGPAEEEEPARVEVLAEAPLEAEPPEEEVAAGLPEPEAPAARVADDLKVIEGIGPKISQVLSAAGIGSFPELAAASPERIEEILMAESSRLAALADPTTWPAQAKLAAEGQWDELQALQDRLVGGRAGGPSPT